MAGYKGGRIKRIKIHNFMTYEDLELYPKKGLNLILGLNGTGKSSIMCAICLALAGKPQLTGRASQLSDFIKHGHQEAEVEIELESRNGSVVICRKLKGDKCEWYLNRCPSSQNEVSATVKKFNIDTGNLCQFLPQEKVVEFSRMDKKQRLENMLQAIGEPHLFELFNELKVLYKKYCETEQVVKKIKSNKNSAEEENERISDEVKKQENRVRLKRELDEFYKQKQLLVYKEILDAFKVLKEKEKKKQKAVTALKAERNEAVAQEKSIYDLYVKSSNMMEKSKSLKTNLMSKLTNHSNKLSSFNEQVENAKIEYKNRLAEKEAQNKRIHDINKIIEGLEKQLIEEKSKYENYSENEQLNSQALADLQQEISELYQDIEKVTAEKNKVEYGLTQMKSHLAQLQDEQNKKMENLKRRDKHSYQAACWLLENKNSFKANVYLPIMLEINTNSSEYSKYIENTIAFKDLIAFVCEDKSDCERLTDILKKQQKLPVNIVMAPNVPMSNYVSPTLSQELRKCGLEYFIADLFTAPEPIMKYLCACYNIHRIPVTKSAIVGNRIDFILRYYSMFYTDNIRVTAKRSRYGQKNVSVTKDFIVARNLLVNHNDELQNEIKQKIHAMEEQLEKRRRILSEYQASLQDKEKNQFKLRQDKKYLQDQKKNIEKLKFNYIQKKKFRTQISVVIDEEEEKVKITKKIQSINENRHTVFADFNTVLKDFIQVEQEIIKFILKLNTLSRNLKLTKAANEDIHERLKVAEKEHQEVSKLYQEKKRAGLLLVEEIKPWGGKYLKYLEAPNLIPMDFSAEEIEQKMNHIQAQLDLNEDNEPLVVEYNARKRKIEALQKQISEGQVSLNELKNEIEEKKREWLKPLQKHIANIDKKFSRYFKQLSCAGEINLDIPENTDDFSKYGLQIKLKFHEDCPLTELSQTHHSGGECSVTAIVFILSLQEFTEVPFRCIDEINQGMDSVNERKIYQLIADSVGEDRCSQYFLLTPKLLEGLEYPQDIAVHVIFNSFFLNCKINTKKHIEIAKST